MFGQTVSRPFGGIQKRLLLLVLLLLNFNLLRAFLVLEALLLLHAYHPCPRKLLRPEEMIPTKTENARRFQIFIEKEHSARCRMLVNFSEEH
jgi:hypothetical protein